MSLTEYVKRELRTISVVSALSLATFLGTCTGYDSTGRYKVGTSCGINIGFFNDYAPESKFYGINLSLGMRAKKASFSGLDIHLVGTTDSCEMNGVMAGWSNVNQNNHSTINGLEIGGGNGSGNTDIRNRNDPTPTVNGMQIALFLNSAKAGHVLQLGLINYVEGKSQDHYMLFFNGGWE